MKQDKDLIKCLRNGINLSKPVSGFRVIETKANKSKNQKSLDKKKSQPIDKKIITCKCGKPIKYMPYYCGVCKMGSMGKAKIVVVGLLKKCSPLVSDKLNVKPKK